MRGDLLCIAVSFCCCYCCVGMPQHSEIWPEEEDDEEEVVEEEALERACHPGDTLLNIPGMYK